MRLAAAANPREYTNPGVPKPWAITRALEPMQIAANAASVAIRSHGTQRAGILATVRYNDAITTTCRHGAATNCHSIAGSCRNAVSGNILMISRMVFGRHHHLSHNSQASTATAMPYANPVRRRSCGDARRMLLLVMSVDSLIVGSFEGESGISHIVKARLPRIAAKPHTNGQTFRGRGSHLRFRGLISCSPNVYLRFEGLPKRDARGIERQSPLESCGFGGAYTWPPTPRNADRCSDQTESPPRNADSLLTALICAISHPTRCRYSSGSSGRASLSVESVTFTVPFPAAFGLVVSVGLSNAATCPT